jgi:hypothetical protein
MSGVVQVSGKVGQSPYARIDAIGEEISGSAATFSSLLAAEPRVVRPDEWAALAKKYDLIRSWQQTSLRLLAASIREEIPRTIASALLDHLPHHFGWGHHARLDWQPVSPPVFFRTDHAADGTRKSSVQARCPECTKSFTPIIRRRASSAPERASHCRRSLPRPCGRIWAVARSFITCSTTLPIPPASASSFTGSAPAPFNFGYDKDVRPQDCNFVRAHDFFGLLTENFAAERLRLSANGTCVYDLPPVALFDQKVLLAFPFWDETRGYFSDDIRGLFPYTTVLAPKGVRLETGDWATLEQFSALPPLQAKVLPQICRSRRCPKLGQPRRFSSRYRHE